jgi:hypothetical protein
MVDELCMPDDVIEKTVKMLGLSDEARDAWLERASSEKAFDHPGVVGAGSWFHPGVGHEAWRHGISVAAAATHGTEAAALRHAHWVLPMSDWERVSEAEWSGYWQSHLCQWRHAYFNRNKSDKDQRDPSISTQPQMMYDLDFQNASSNYDSKTCFVPIFSATDSIAAVYQDGAPIAAPFEDFLWHGTRDQLVPLILRNGLKGSDLSHGVQGLWCSKAKEWALDWGSTPFDFFIGCAVHVAVPLGANSTRENRRIGKMRAVVETGEKRSFPCLRLIGVTFRLGSPAQFEWRESLHVALSQGCQQEWWLSHLASSTRKKIFKQTWGLLMTRWCYQVMPFANHEMMTGRWKTVSRAASSLSFALFLILRSVCLMTSRNMDKRLERLKNDGHWGLLPAAVQDWLRQRYGDELERACGDYNYWYPYRKLEDFWATSAVSTEAARVLYREVNIERLVQTLETLVRQRAELAAKEQEELQQLRRSGVIRRARHKRLLAHAAGSVAKRWQRDSML